jgi:hypothetical protein
MMRWLFLAVLLTGTIGLGHELSACRLPESETITAERAAPVAEPAPNEPATTAAATVPDPSPVQEPAAAPPEIVEKPDKPKKQADPKPVAPISDDEFMDNAFPPILPDTERHQQAWLRNDCMRCHETGVEEAPVLEHKDLPPILLTAKCRSCHVLIPGTPVPPKPKVDPAEDDFAGFAFPPMIPASGSHLETWTRDDCMLCHEDGTKDAPIVVHKDLPRLYLEVKCRSCHVQVRAVEASEKEPIR